MTNRSGRGELPTAEQSALAEQLAAARDLYMTFDPDSPPWAIESELRRLEDRWSAMMTRTSAPRDTAVERSG